MSWHIPSDDTKSIQMQTHGNARKYNLPELQSNLINYAIKRSFYCMIPSEEGRGDIIKDKKKTFVTMQMQNIVSIACKRMKTCFNISISV